MHLEACHACLLARTQELTIAIASAISICYVAEPTGQAASTVGVSSPPLPGQPTRRQSTCKLFEPQRLTSDITDSGRRYMC